MPSIISTRRNWAPACWALAAALAAVPLQAQARTFHTDAVFTSSAAGGPFNPNGGLAADAQGRLYGVTSEGGTGASGTVYRLTPGALKSDPWTTEILHNFTGFDGDSPFGTLYIDPAGAVYGTTLYGGRAARGNVYRLDNLPGWPITVLHTFGNQPDAAYPRVGLQPGRDGLLYGTASAGGLTGVGAVFAISPRGDRVSYQVIHSFDAAVDGIVPLDFTIQGDGALYGISNLDDAAVVFHLVEKDNVWRDYLIYTPATGRLNSILKGPDGVLFLCNNRGSDGYAIQLSPPPASGPWIENDLYRFERHLGGCTSLTINPSGGFLGGSPPGGAEYSGTVFSLTPSSTGTTAYTFRTLHRFPDAYERTAGALLRLGGLYYGATTSSADLAGEVFDVRP